ncbi:hypothetical protein B5F35_16345 [Anaeromassilibacillus sp. An200]|nr:hypothetical protein B5F35_16345 [Anaeromassilibacillus sp. An200]
MKYNMIKKLKLVSLKVLMFCTSYFLVFLFLFALFRCFNEFEILPDTVYLPASVLFSAVVAIGFRICSVLSKKYTKKTKLKNFWEMNYSYFLLAYFISIFCMVSLKSEIVWTLEKLEEILSLEWTIFSISITIFLVWNVLILQFLKEKQPSEEKSNSLINKIGYIQKKANFHGQASLFFNSVYLLTINLIVLLFATSVVHFSTEQTVTILNQTVTSITFYFCTNTISILFLDILKPLSQEKKTMLEESKVTTEDLNLQNKVSEISNQALKAFKAIEELSTLSKDKKTEMQNVILAEAMQQLTGIQDQSEYIEGGEK